MISEADDFVSNLCYICTCTFSSGKKLVVSQVQSCVGESPSTYIKQRIFKFSKTSYRLAWPDRAERPFNTIGSGEYRVLVSNYLF